MSIEATRLKTPSFKGLHPASSLASKVKSANRSVRTAHERLFQLELKRTGLKFNRNVRSLVGKPDIVFREAQVAVFCDGDFWHGRNPSRLLQKLRTGTNSQYWMAKIARNVQRDTDVNKLLRRSGWLVLRFWETDIKKAPRLLASKVKSIVRRRSHRKAQQNALY
jgi:DNA mismatch endonuclease (patch repair protein)